MSDLVFPATLRPVVSKGYGQERGRNIIRTEVQQGMPRQTRDTYYDTVPINVALVVSKLGRQVFWGFIAKIDGGASSFIMNHDTGNGIEPHNVLITSNISETTQNGCYWTITFTATAERTSIQDESEWMDELLKFYDMYGDGLNAFFNAMTTRVTTYPFINQLPEPEDDPA